MSIFRRYEKHLLAGMAVTVFLLLSSSSYVFAEAKTATVGTDTTRPVSAARQAQAVAPKLLPSYRSPKQFGVYLHDRYDTSYTETILGAKLDLVGFFEQWGQPESSVNKLRFACKNGYTPLISWESWSGSSKDQNTFPLADIAAGKYEQKISDFLQRIADECGEQSVIVRFDHEMEMRPTYGYAWYPWQGYPDAYVAAWRHIVGMAQQRNANVKWLWSPNRADQYTTAYYPGDEYVDYVGLTLNHPPTRKPKMQSFAEFYGAYQQALEAYGKPVLIGETAYASADEVEMTAWAEGMFAYIQSNPQIVGFVWLDKQFPHLDYRLNATPALAETFKQQLMRMRAGQ